jgi:hypothetical protein
VHVTFWKSLGIFQNIYVVFADQVFLQFMGIPIGTICAPLLADSYEAEFVQKLLQDKNQKLVETFNHIYRYIDDVLLVNNHNFHNYVHLIYPYELEIKDTTESDICKSMFCLWELFKVRPITDKKVDIAGL